MSKPLVNNNHFFLQKIYISNLKNRMSKAKYQSTVTVNELLNYYFPPNSRNRSVNIMAKDLVVPKLKKEYPNHFDKNLGQIKDEIVTSLINQLPKDVKQSTPRTTLDQFKYTLEHEIKTYYYSNHKGNINNLPSPTLKDLLLYAKNTSDEDLLKMTTEDIIDLFVQELIKELDKEAKNSNNEDTKQFHKTFGDEMTSKNYSELLKLAINDIIGNIPKEVLKQTPESVIQDLIDKISAKVSKQIKSDYNKNSALGHTNSVKEMEDVANNSLKNMTPEDANNNNDYEQRMDYYTQDNSNRNNSDETNFMNVELNGKIPFYTEWTDNQPLNVNNNDNTNQTNNNKFDKNDQIFYDPTTNSSIDVAHNEHILPTNATKGSQVKIYEDPTTGQEYYYVKGYQLLIPIKKENNLKKTPNGQLINQNTNQLVNVPTTNNNSESGNSNNNVVNNNANKNNKNNKNNNSVNNNVNNNNVNNNSVNNNVVNNNVVNNNTNKNKNNNNNNSVNNVNKKNTVNNKNNNGNNKDSKNNTESGNNNNARLNKLKELNDKVNNIEQVNNNNNNKNDNDDSYVVSIIHRNMTDETGKQITKTILSIAIIILCVIFIYFLFQYFGSRPNYPPPPQMMNNNMGTGKSVNVRK